MILVGLLGCGPATAPPLPSDPAPPTCSENLVELVVVGTGADARFFVEAVWEDEPVALQLDTGSGLTFLFRGAGTPDYEPAIGELSIGCETIGVAGRGFDAPGTTIDGLPVVGLLGMDFLLGRTSTLDVDTATLERHDRAPEGLAIPFDIVQDHALVPVQLDGFDLRLLFDTGGGDTLWVGQAGRPGDQEVLVQDFEGNIFPVYVGSGELSAGELGTRTVPVARAPHFPYFEGTVAALGGNVHGLLGVTAFPGEALTFAGQTLYVQ